jgi:hypothetical protein
MIKQFCTQIIGDILTKENALVKRTLFRSGAMIFDRNTAA